MVCTIWGKCQCATETQSREIVRRGQTQLASSDVGQIPALAHSLKAKVRAAHRGAWQCSGRGKTTAASLLGLQEEFHCHFRGSFKEMDSLLCSYHR